ncbi:MAG: hypothetical protein Q7T51_00795 [Candidatus Moranbacteria bacterium]|nr:hypothetical protein [Candidatus Moranbacteria bacterium]
MSIENPSVVTNGKEKVVDKEDYVFNQFVDYRGFINRVLEKRRQVVEAGRTIDLASDDFVGLILEDCPRDISQHSLNILRCVIRDIITKADQENSSENNEKVEMPKDSCIGEKTLKGARIKSFYEELNKERFGIDKDRK